MALVPFPSASSSPARRDPDEDEPPDDDLDGAGGKMSFLEHLDELRNRLIVCVYALIGGCAVSFFFVDRLETFIMLPMAEIMGGKLISFAIPFVLLGTFFFVAGAAFSHYVAFPYSWEFFKSFESNFMEFKPDVSYAFSLWVKMLLAFGVIFQMPTIVFFLARMGLVTAGFLIKHTKYAVLIIFILGAVLSPGTDVVSQAMMAGPMLVLYALSIGIAWLFAKRKTA
jgi:sec-independent protein translocase protein TatC